MDMNIFNEFAVPVIVGTCLCIGYILKHLVTTDAINRWIPLIMGVLGVAMHVWMKQAISPEILLGGLFSGLASTGLHQVFKQLINKEA